jgi:hypothetical protein
MRWLDRKILTDGEQQPPILTDISADVYEMTANAKGYAGYECHLDYFRDVVERRLYTASSYLGQRRDLGLSTHVHLI